MHPFISSFVKGGKKESTTLRPSICRLEVGTAKAHGERPHPLPFRASLELSRELVVRVSEAARRSVSGQGAGSLLTASPFSARFGGARWPTSRWMSLSGSAERRPRDGERPSPLLGARGARCFAGFRGGEGSSPGRDARSRLRPPPASAALLIGRAARAHPLASPLVTGPGRPSRGRAEGWAGPAFPTR